MEAGLATVLQQDVGINSNMNGIVDGRLDEVIDAALAGRNIYDEGVKPYAQSVYDNIIRTKDDKIRTIISASNPSPTAQAKDYTAWTTDMINRLWADPRAAIQTHATPSSDLDGLINKILSTPEDITDNIDTKVPTLINTINPRSDFAVSICRIVFNKDAFAEQFNLAPGMGFKDNYNIVRVAQDRESLPYDNKNIILQITSAGILISEWAEFAIQEKRNR
nr:MAG: hypothetical protein [White spot syndrome virus]